ncbi:hypothetical protein HanXRQr2_Chr04g0185191 [Helianthus annuus]|uniref:Uncharacterized protein n=1 Tax=Helianthus annuus TaxID=4232 RepID=A0A9K3NT09_HELAN|nr:hypothetical protein HanXRQr2_Chr04g0185191 [Helianthus annuus]KAJ0932876.1 hypothetical protein HanPSC8_Chr04g0178731 [Helianthus annuus]
MITPRASAAERGVTNTRHVQVNVMTLMKIKMKTSSRKKMTQVMDTIQIKYLLT